MPALRVPGIRGRRWLGRVVLAVSHPLQHWDVAITIILGRELALPGTSSEMAGLPCAVALGFPTRGRSTTRFPIPVGTRPTTPWTASQTFWVVTSTRLCTDLSEADLPGSRGRLPRSSIPGAGSRPRETYRVGILR